MHAVQPYTHTYTQTRTHARTCTCPFNGPLSSTTRVSRYQKCKTNLDFTEERDSEWHWHQLGHMQVCISLQTDNNATPTAQLFTGRMPFLPPNQQHQSTEDSTALQCDKTVQIPGSSSPLAMPCRATLSARDGVRVDVSTVLRHF